jgi:hypothetical protein
MGSIKSKRKFESPSTHIEGLSVLLGAQAYFMPILRHVNLRLLPFRFRFFR